MSCVLKLFFIKYDAKSIFFVVVVVWCFFLCTCLPKLHRHNLHSCKYTNNIIIITCILCLKMVLLWSQCFEFNCGFHINFSSRRTPNVFTDSALLVLWLVIFNFGWARGIVSIFLDLWKNQYFVFANLVRVC